MSDLPENYISQLHGNVQKNPQKIRYFVHLGSNEKKNSAKYLNKIEARFAEVKYKMNNLKIK